LRMPMPLIVVSAAAAAAVSRLVLAYVTRLLRNRLSDRMTARLDSAYAALDRRRHGRLFILAVFVVSPISNAFLFEAAGLAGMRLGAPTLAFFVGRVAYYTFYALTARTVAAQSVGSALYDKITSPLGIGAHIGLVIALAVLIFLEWRKWLARRQDGASD
jgi:membrane protein YqaA with SNARE-associated domain